MSKKEKVIDRLMDLQESYDKEYIKMRELISKTKTKKMSKKELIEAILDIIHSADSGLSTHQRVSEIEKVLNQNKEEKEGIETHRWGYRH